MIDAHMSYANIFLKSDQKKAGRSLLWSSLLSEPLFTVYGLIAFILYKDLGATPFQIALMTMLKPVVTILSFYWSAGLGRFQRLKSNLLWAGFLMRAPFLLCPWVDSIWFVIGAAVNYMFFYRAGMPAWLEILKRNMDPEKRGRLFSITTGIAYAEGIVLSLAFGALLDHNPGIWKALFFGTALVGLFVLLVQSRMPVEEEGEKERLSLKEIVTRPWKDSYRLMRDRPDFSRFQWGFMIAGLGIMLIQPALPVFAIDDLGVSYMEIAGAISIAKGLGFSLSSFVWAKWIDKVPILRLSSVVFLSFGLFPLLLSFSVWGIVWFYLAFFWYGVGQGGSHLVWNMSGLIFSGKEDSSRYTGVNVVLAGLRGAVGPSLGSFLTVIWGPIVVLWIGGLLGFYSGLRLLRNREKETLLS
jgi:MFS family permease